MIKVACIGNSITQGVGVAQPFHDSYPGILSQMLGEQYDVRNFGLSSRTLLKKGELPYMFEPIYRKVQDFCPDIITIKLGTNDSKPHNWIYKEEFGKDLKEMVHTLRDLPSKPKIYLCLPIPTTNNYGINDSIIRNGIIPIIKKLAKEEKLGIVDLYTALKPYPEVLPDRVHPNEEGALRIAVEIYKKLMGKEAPYYKLRKPFPGEKSQWEGFDRYDFNYKNRKAIVVVPQKEAKGRPWIWRPAFFGAFASVDKALLSQGFHVVYYDLTHLYGSPRSLILGNDFYDLITKSYHLSGKVTMEGFSRGGLFAINWASENPQKVACLYVDAPVCNLQSWPGRNRPDLWKGMLSEWQLKDSDMDRFTGNPIDRLLPLCKANIPIIAVCGDSDIDVPYSENMKILRDRYQAMGGIVEVILKPGCGHHPHSLDDPSRVVDFIQRYQKDYDQTQHITRRRPLANAYLKFTQEKKGCVAFLGGSITEMNGWRNLIKESLKQRFPYTDFTFIEAGISSTGTTPHAFRLKNDILDKSQPDLLFVEAAVNDYVNGFDYIAQTRAMEGIIRHALRENAHMDIIMMHFICDEFVAMMQSGKFPDVIYNHERIANYYGIPTLNLAQEIIERMEKKEFSWKEFGGTHPLPLGHKYYAATINRLFDLEWQKIPSHSTYTSYTLPTVALDKYNYSGGEFIPLSSAKKKKGWTVVEDWKPETKVSTRKGFVNVAMLETKESGSKFELDFTGTAVGIFCICGPQAGILEYSIDGAPFKKIDTYTAWSKNLYLPWVYMFDTELENTTHTLRVKMASGERTECQIRNFVVNKK